MELQVPYPTVRAQDGIMESTGDKIRGSLHTMLTQAAIDFDMWIAMRKARSEKDVLEMINRQYGRFYISAENAFFNSLVTILYSVFEKRSDTANFWTLKKQIIEYATVKELQEIEEEFNRINKIWIRIGIIRNEVVGHQTLKRTKDESHEIAGMTIRDLKDMIAKSQKLLFHIASKFQDTHVVFNLRGAESFERLVEDLRSNKSIQPTAERAR